MKNNVEELLKIPLVCPKSKARLFRDGESLVSLDAQSRLRYPIRDEIPVMLIEEAESLSVEAWQALCDAHHDEVERFKQESGPAPTAPA